VDQALLTGPADGRTIAAQAPTEEVQMSTSERPVDRTTRHLDEVGIEYEVVEHEQAFGAASEATASGVRPDNAAKSVLLHVGDGYRLVVIQASDRLDLGKVRDLLDTSRGSLRLVSENEMAAEFPHFELGAIPPLGEMLPAPEIVDRRVLEHDRVLCNGGDHTHSILVDPNDVVRASDAQVADVSED
jgi:prolyl-tRNA editing enzyme YbaK/EbsC (Cys-tRNA(Pro) deacylase)